MPHNGPAVWLGAVGAAVPSFLPPDSYRDPVDGRDAKGHGETFKRYQVQIDGSEVSYHDEIV